MTPAQLKKERASKTLSQYALGKKAKVSRNKISVFENGYGRLTPEEIHRIKGVLK